MKGQVFISREPRQEGILAQTLARLGYALWGESLLLFEDCPPPNPLPEVDWYFFYSAQGVGALARQHSGPWPKLGVLGAGTARALAEFGLQADFVGNGRPEDTAQAFLAEAKGQRVAFWRAAASRQSLQKGLKGEVQAWDYVIYTNRPKAQVPYAGEVALLIFTSPLSAKTYFEAWPWQKGQQLLAIGESTGQALRELGFKPAIAPSPDEACLAQEAAELLGDYRAGR